jgi:molybdopterin molybdotransferase
MISVQEATHTILSNLPTLSTEECHLHMAHGRILRQDITADRDLPPFDRIMMDGIAINYEGIQSLQCDSRRCKIEGHQPAGSPKMELGNSVSCIEVATGATLPVGTDTVIPIEQLTIEGNYATIHPRSDFQQWQYIHKQASDHSEGTILLAPGTLLSPKEIAVAASAGLSTISVSRLPTIALISTGDELVPIEETPLPHQIRQSNAHMLASAIQTQKLGIPSQYHLPDEPDHLLNGITCILEQYDVLIFSGGVSKGKKDFLPQTLERLGVQKKLHWVAQRPGKPLWFGISTERKPVFGLPGNPLSTLTCFHRYIAPALKAMAARSPEQFMHVQLADDFEFQPPLTCFLPVKLINQSAETKAIPCPANNSGDYSGILETSGFVEIPQDVTNAVQGTWYPFYPW